MKATCWHRQSPRELPLCSAVQLYNVRSRTNHNRHHLWHRHQVLYIYFLFMYIFIYYDPYDYYLLPVSISSMQALGEQGFFPRYIQNSAWPIGAQQVTEYPRAPGSRVDINPHFTDKQLEAQGKYVTFTKVQIRQGDGKIRSMVPLSLHSPCNLLSQKCPFPALKLGVNHLPGGLLDE